MNRLVSTILILVIALSAFPQTGSALQRTNGKIMPDEKVTLLTDRTLYITGETIFLSCFIHTQFPADLTQPSPSKIIYLELITPSGNRIAAQKYKTDAQHCMGSLHIPGSIESGIYYLRAYTRYQRNFGPATFAYQSLKIINPSSEEVLKENQSAKEENKSKPRIDTVLTPENYFTVSLEKDLFSTREKVSFTIQSEAPAGDQHAHAIINVIPKETYKTTVVIPGAPDSSPGSKQRNSSNTQPQFQKETKGLIISGRSDNIDRSKPGAGQVNMTLINEPVNLFYPVKTDSAGHFSFTMPDLFEPHEIYIAPASPAAGSQVKVDNDFCTEKITLPAPLFSLDSTEAAAALRLAQNATIQRQFNGDPTKTPESKRGMNRDEFNGSTRNILLNDSTPFYGRPDQVIYINEYIEMPRLQDYITELQVPVRIRHVNTMPTLQVISKDQAAGIFPPLVMVDFVQLHDMKAFLNLDPSKIERLEFVTSAYIRGSQIYGGIISVVSVDNDFAGATLPETGLFLDYQFLEPETGFTRTGVAIETAPEVVSARSTETGRLDYALQPEQSRSNIQRNEPDREGYEQQPDNGDKVIQNSGPMQELSVRQPDARNTLFMQTITDMPEGNVTFKFITGDAKGIFEIIVSGYTEKGDFIQTKKQFSVR